MRAVGEGEDADGGRGEGDGWMQGSRDNQEVKCDCGGGGYRACFHGNLLVKGDGMGMGGFSCIYMYVCNMVGQSG